jgi:hypothetical protein
MIIPVKMDVESGYPVFRHTRSGLAFTGIFAEALCIKAFFKSRRAILKALEQNPYPRLRAGDIYRQSACDPSLGGGAFVKVASTKD